ncbi:MAG: hypothetical protein ACM4AI_05150 [Acidobacteriota bacterium]
MMIHLLWLAGAALVIWKYAHHLLGAGVPGTVSAQWLEEYRREGYTNR